MCICPGAYVLVQLQTCKVNNYGCSAYTPNIKTLGSNMNVELPLGLKNVTLFEVKAQEVYENGRLISVRLVEPTKLITWCRLCTISRFAMS